MKALVFGRFPDPAPAPPPEDAPRLVKHLAMTPMDLVDTPDPTLLGDDWAVIRPRLTGICGSDTKQVLMDFEDADDSPMTAFISFPQVLGHEVVATIEQLGPAVNGFETGQRVVLLPEGLGIDELAGALRSGADFSVVKITPTHLEALGHMLAPEKLAPDRINGPSRRGHAACPTLPEFERAINAPVGPFAAGRAGHDIVFQIALVSGHAAHRGIGKGAHQGAQRFSRVHAIRV